MLPRNLLGLDINVVENLNVVGDKPDRHRNDMPDAPFGELRDVGCQLGSEPWLAATSGRLVAPGPLVIGQSCLGRHKLRGFPDLGIVGVTRIHDARGETVSAEDHMHLVAFAFRPTTQTILDPVSQRTDQTGSIMIAVNVGELDMPTVQLQRSTQFCLVFVDAQLAEVRGQHQADRTGDAVVQHVTHGVLDPGGPMTHAEVDFETRGIEVR